MKRLMIVLSLVAISTADASACGLLAGLRQRGEQRRAGRSAVGQRPAAACQSCAAPATATTHTVDSPRDVTQVAFGRMAPVSGLLDAPCPNGRCPVPAR